MYKLLAVVGLCAIACVVGAVGAAWMLREKEVPPPEVPAVVEQMRDVARLETLHLSMHKKISFEPSPNSADSLWGDVANFVRFTVRKPQGRAIVFAQVELGLDLERLTADNLRVDGRRVEVVMPPVEAQVQLLPSETEVIGSNLDTQETAQLFDRAKAAFEREVLADPKLQQRARASNERALKALLYTLGFREVVFVERFSPLPVRGAG